MSHTAILGPGGAIAQLLPNFESRPQQLHMADAIAGAIAQRRHVMVEAGTGVGKSFAYLVPAILAATADPDCRIVVSTHTISLQEQLIAKDLPFLQKVSPKPFVAVLAKGRSNYLSRRRLRVARQRQDTLLAEDQARREMARIDSWAENSRDGSRSDLDFKPLPPVWELVASDGNNCLGKKCPDYNSCFFFKARARIHKADILVVNHALFFSDLALRGGGSAKILPDYQVAILDEAHTLEDVAAEHLGLQITRGQIEFLLNKLFRERGTTSHGLLALHYDQAAINQVYAVRDAADRFFGQLQKWHQDHRPNRSALGEQAQGTVRVKQAQIVEDSLSSPLLKLGECVAKACEEITRDEEKIELEAAATRCAELAGMLTDWLGQKLPDQVYWIDATGGRFPRVSLASAPIAVGPILRQQLFDTVPTVVLTSATLSVGGSRGFEYFRGRLGFPKHPTVQLGSPFDFRSQAELHLFRHMPEPNSPDFEAAALAKIKDYVERTAGRAFVLFTSSKMLHQATISLRPWCLANGYTLLSQDDGLPSSQLVQRFRQTPRAVLLGVDTFWQGVDVQGEALSNVIITRLPFVPPDRPVNEARIEKLQNEGGNPFFDLSVPQAVIKLKQGFGRLIRTKNDRGLVVILDPRVLTKRYGRSFLDALPACRTFIDGVEV